MSRGGVSASSEEISWFYGSPLLLAVLIIAVFTLAGALIVSTVREHRHPYGGKR